MHFCIGRVCRRAYYGLALRPRIDSRGPAARRKSKSAVDGFQPTPGPARDGCGRKVADAPPEYHARRILTERAGVTVGEGERAWPVLKSNDDLVRTRQQEGHDVDLRQL